MPDDKGLETPQNEEIIPESESFRQTLADTVRGLIRVRDTIKALNKIQDRTNEIRSTVDSVESELLKKIDGIDNRLIALSAIMATLHPENALLQRLGDPNSKSG